MKPTLKVFVAENCLGCEESLRIAGHLKQDHPDVITVEVINITDAQATVPEAVFATPTFMLDGCIVCLGNPSPEKISEWVDEASPVQSEL